jgi:glycosyltransferase involved in cell wall biosynthesis
MTRESRNVKENPGKFNKSVSLLSWAYNEEDSIQEYLEKSTGLMDATVEDYEIILIDDGSTDRTYEIAEAFRSKNNRLKIFRNERNLNVGISSQIAIQKSSKEYLFWQTIDWCYDITHLRLFLEYLHEYDIVQGVRKAPVQVRLKLLRPLADLLRLFGIKHLTRRSDTVSKAIVSVINYIFVRTLFLVPLSDFQNVTLYPTKWIQSIDFEAKSSFVSPEGLIKSYWNGMSIKEVPINFIPRTQGTARGTRPKAIMSSVQDILRLWFKWVVLRKRNFAGKGKICVLDNEEWKTIDENTTVDSSYGPKKVLR